MGLNQYQYLWLKSPSAVVTFPSFFRYEFADRFQLCSLRFLMMVIIYVFAPCLFSGRWIQPGAFPGRFSGAEIGPFWWWGKTSNPIHGGLGGLHIQRPWRTTQNQWGNPEEKSQRLMFGSNMVQLSLIANNRGANIQMAQLRVPLVCNSWGN